MTSGIAHGKTTAIAKAQTSEKQSISNSLKQMHVVETKNANRCGQVKSIIEVGCYGVGDASRFGAFTSDIAVARARLVAKVRW